MWEDNPPQFYTNSVWPHAVELRQILIAAMRLRPKPSSSDEDFDFVASTAIFIAVSTHFK